MDKENIIVLLISILFIAGICFGGYKLFVLSSIQQTEKRQYEAIRRGIDAKIESGRVKKCESSNPTRTAITSVTKDSTISGKMTGDINGFVIGLAGLGMYGKVDGKESGEFKTELYYYFYKILPNSSFKLDKVPVEQTTISEKDEQPVLETYLDCGTNTVLEYIIIVPVGSIVKDFRL